MNKYTESLLDRAKRDIAAKREANTEKRELEKRLSEAVDAFNAALAKLEGRHLASAGLVKLPGSLMKLWRGEMSGAYTDGNWEPLKVVMQEIARQVVQERLNKHFFEQAHPTEANIDARVDARLRAWGLVPPLSTCIDDPIASPSTGRKRTPGLPSLCAQLDTALDALRDADICSLPRARRQIWELFSKALDMGRL